MGAAVMASIVTSRLEPSGLPQQSGYTTGFAVMTGGLLLAAVAGTLIPAAGRVRQPGEAVPLAEIPVAAGAPAEGDAPA
jgi:hypothetical protein